MDMTIDLFVAIIIITGGIASMTFLIVLFIVLPIKLIKDYKSKDTSPDKLDAYYEYIKRTISENKILDDYYEENDEHDNRYHRNDVKGI